RQHRPVNLQVRRERPRDWGLAHCAHPNSLDAGAKLGSVPSQSAPLSQCSDLYIKAPAHASFRLRRKISVEITIHNGHYIKPGFVKSEGKVAGMRFDLADLSLFRHVVEAGSITHGAERAH